MSKFHQHWRTTNPVEAERLRKEEPEHLRMMADGYSWIEMVGGPKDGCRHYFVGPPHYRLTCPDPGVNPHAWKVGDLEHLYALGSDRETGLTVYKWKGTFRRKPE